MKTGEKATKLSLTALRSKTSGRKRNPRSSESHSTHVDGSDGHSQWVPTISLPRRELEIKFHTSFCMSSSRDLFSIQYISEMYLLKPEMQTATLKSGNSNHMCTSRPHNLPDKPITLYLNLILL